MDPSAPRDPNAPSQQTPQSGGFGAPDTAPPPASPPPGAPGQQNWQSQPGAPPPQGTWQGQPGSAAGTGQPAWMTSLTSKEVVAGPAGHVYADIPNRAIAMVIDVIGILVVYFIVGVITVAIFGFNAGFFQIPTTTSLLAQQVISALIWAAYFMYTWVNMRGTLGMKALGLQIGHEADGRTLTYEQAAWRFGVLFGPQIVVGLLGAIIPALNILGLLSFVWLIYVLITIAQSPTKQGIHDKFAHSMVVKAARTIA
jgi:uncharacterized RDD family membrane protein YckC